MDFKKTNRQKQATTLLTSGAKHVMLYGGSRSGKTFLLCHSLIVRASKTKSRHLACRLRFNHAKTSLWYETFPKVFALAFPDLKYDSHKTDFVYTLPNGSEIWVGGLDDKERTEKILGKEYSTIYFNECSQIPYSSVNIALTRLAEKNNLAKKVYYDENPPTQRHWSYPLFIKGLDPDSWEPRADAKNYAAFLINPEDNIDNIDPDYITDVLDHLPERERDRFKHGTFTADSNGSIYYAFKREVNVQPLARVNGIPLTIGLDFNVSPFTGVICQIVKDTINVIDEIFVENSHTKEICEIISRRYPGQWTIIPDSTGNARKTASAGLTDHLILRNHGYNVPFVQNPFRVDRYNEVNAMLESGRIKIDPKCVKLIKDLEQVSYKEGTNMPETKDLSLTHISDALGYLVHWAFPMIKFSGGVSMFDR